MANKYYAVKKGLTPGIYDSWEKCKANVDGVSGAEFKSFRTEEEAREYLGLTSAKEEVVNSDFHSVSKEKKLTAYVDGSFNFIHASIKGVKVSNSKERYYSRRYVGARRVMQ